MFKSLDDWRKAQPAIMSNSYISKILQAN
uniref:Uncharacterized protein n=1 Tax=Anguilla anguilla TaxID=7936 RepID=A0A0E9TVA7_ANGAN